MEVVSFSYFIITRQPLRDSGAVIQLFASEDQVRSG
jgi:hypothetical protein